MKQEWNRELSNVNMYEMSRIEMCMNERTDDLPERFCFATFYFIGTAAATCINKPKFRAFS